ncbi:MAG: hypothetical protein E7233_06150 [Lachnospiraceae bacterium]|nr:hypothetical protein [Lachnospiraceae bacterium]
MYSKEDLLLLSEIPFIDDVTLTLYKDFSESYLLPQKFCYEFLDGSKITVKFTEWGIYHMLAIQHIDGNIKKNQFFAEITNGLSFNDFKVTNRKKKRFADNKRRISMFSCVYNTLKNGRVFYLPSGNVKNTANVNVDFIIYDKLKLLTTTEPAYNGINIGLRQVNNDYIPITILVSKASDIEEYIINEQAKIVRSLQIFSEQNELLSEIHYDFIM